MRSRSISASGRGILLVALLLIAAGCSQKPAEADSGVEGIVLAGPACGGPEDVGSPCPDKPTRAEISLTSQSSGKVEGVALAREDGRFRTTVAPGVYVLTAQPSGALFCKPMNVTVAKGKFTKVTVSCDTGVR